MEKGVSFNCFEKAEAVGGKLLGFVNNTHQCPEDDGIVAETTTTDKGKLLVEKKNTQPCPGPKKIYLLEQPWFIPGLIIIWLVSMFCECELSVLMCSE